MAVQQQRHLVLRGNGRQFGAAQSQRARLDHALPRRERLNRIPLPRGAVQDGLPIGRKSRRANLAAAERNLVIQRRARRRRLTTTAFRRATRSPPQPEIPQPISTGSSLLRFSAAGSTTAAAAGVATGADPEATRAGMRPRRIRVALQPLQVGAQLGRALAAQVAVFFQRLVQDGLDLRRQSRIQLHRRHRHLVQDRVKHNRRSGPRKRLLARSPSHTAPRQTKTGRCEHPATRRAPAPATCSQSSPSPCPAS